jgi:hypothetical protein
VTEIRLEYTPQPRQALLHGTPAHQIFYGGAVGGGKSHALRWDAIGFCLDNPGLDAYLFRRTRAELSMTHIRRIELELPSELGRLNKTENRFEFRNGSILNFCYCENESDVTRYQSAEFHWLGVDEASHLTEFQMVYLRGRVRLGDWKPSRWNGESGDKFKGLLPRIVFASNPGGPGHDFLKRTFIQPCEPEKIFADRSMSEFEDDAPWPSIFIPAKIRDNKFLAKGYAGQFKALGPEMYKALTEGDWDAVVGQALHNLSRERHFIKPFPPPRHWTKFMVIDWGSAKPFSVGWYTVSEGAVLKDKKDIILPAGALIRYNEWYGWNGQTNKGCGMPSQAVAREILRREEERGEIMDYRIGDSEMWAVHDGPSTMEKMKNSTDGRFVMRKSIKDRKQNYNEIISRLAGDPHFTEDGDEGERPMLFVTSNCEHWWRTVPVLILDSNDPDKGPDTKMEDHCYDDTAYACRSRPFVMTKRDRYLEEWGEEIRRARGKPVDPYATA